MKPADDEARNAPGLPDATPEHSLAEMARQLAAGTMSRRQVLRWIGGTLAGAVLARFPGSASAATTSGETEPAEVVPHGERLRGITVATKDRSLEGRFGLMFKELPPFEPSDDLLITLAASMTEATPDATPDATDVNPPAADVNLPAGFVLLGQFVDHDLTFDNTPMPAQLKDPDALTNFRSARFDLDSVYGNGPTGSPELYDPEDPAKLLIARLGNPNTPDDLPREDLPRRSDLTAFIGDPRDDENLITSQLHLAFMKFHNALVRHVRRHGIRRVETAFKAARRLTRLHYQWLVVHEFLPLMVGQDVVDEILLEPAEGPAEVTLSFYHPENLDKPMMPIEFAAAAYRFGHSMLLPEYLVNDEFHHDEFDPDPLNPTLVSGPVLLFGKAPELPTDPKDPHYDSNLNGRRPLPSTLKIYWPYFFDISGVRNPRANLSRPIDTRLSAPLFDLPTKIVPDPGTRVSLAERNLLRGKRLGLPSGQQVASAMGLPVDRILTGPALDLPNELLGEFGVDTPLWYYILREAQVHENGERLGAVGGRIVAEVFLGLLKFDDSSYLNEDPIFRPEPPIAPETGVFTMGDLLEFAGVA